MAPVLRVLLWLAVVIAPGGILLLPLLAADAMRQRKLAPPAAPSPGLAPELPGPGLVAER